MPRIPNMLRAAGHPALSALAARPRYPLLTRAKKAAQRVGKVLRVKLPRFNTAVRVSDLTFENLSAFPQFLLAATICATALVLLIASFTGLIDTIYGPTWARVFRPLAG